MHFNFFYTKLIFSFVILFFSHSLVSYGQINIGSTDAPVEGALLQLKEDEGRDGNSSRGMLMPRVLLFDVTRLTPMLTLEQNNDQNQRVKHTGLLVYNLTDAPQRGLCPGLYAWNGDVWNSLDSNPILDNIIIYLEDIDGNEYTAGWFGNCDGEGRYWMLQNLRTTRYADDTNNPIYSTTSGVGTTGKFYNYPNGDKTLLDSHPEYGLFYNWYATTNKARAATTINNRNNKEQEIYQGICPDGWHVPSDREWSEMEKEVVENPYKYAEASHDEALVWKEEWYGTSVNQMAIRRGDERLYFSKTVINSQTIPGRSMENGLNVLPIGRYLKGPEYYGINSFFWTSSCAPNQNWDRAWGRDIEVTTGFLGVRQASHHTYDYNSVRCVQDY